MAKLVYSTELEIPGPWLLDSEALQRLDTILDEEMGHLVRLRDEQLSQDVKAYVREFYSELPASEIAEKQEEIRKSWLEDTSFIRDKYRTSREVSIKFANNKTIVAESFDGINRDNAATESLPVSFRAEMRCGGIRCKVSLEKRFNNGLNISVTPEEYREARELFVILRQWASANMVPGWQRLWMKVTSFPYHWLIWGSVIFIALTVLASWANNPGEQAAKARAQQLIDGGISDSNLPEAIETLLMLQTKYYPGQTGSLVIVLPGWLRAWGVFGLIACIILSIKPKVVIGIGKGIERIKLWRQWINIVWITIPGLIFASFGWPLIEQVIRALFK